VPNLILPKGNERVGRGGTEPDVQGGPISRFALELTEDFRAFHDHPYPNEERSGLERFCIYASCAMVVATRRCETALDSPSSYRARVGSVPGVLARGFLPSEPLLCFGHAVVAQLRQLGTASVCDP